MEITRDI